MRVISALLGSLSVELLYWYGIRYKTASKDVQRLLHSPAYWIISTVMVVVGTLVALIVGGDSATNGQLILLGASAPSLLTQAGKAVKPSEVKLGVEDSAVSPWDYFV